jgi:hypothetical protein
MNFVYLYLEIYKKFNFEKTSIVNFQKKLEITSMNNIVKNVNISLGNKLVSKCVAYIHHDQLKHVNELVLSKLVNEMGLMK